jgi:hypothetical protein
LQVCGIAGFCDAWEKVPESPISGSSAALDRDAILALYWVAFHQVLDCRTDQEIR